MKRRWRAVAAVFAVIFGIAVPAQAQDDRSRWETAAGAAWLGGLGLGSAVATLERPGGGTFELFRTETSQDGAVGAVASVSFYATPRLALEAAFSYARPGVSTVVSADAEGAAGVTSTIGLQQYLVEGSARWYLKRSFGRFQPFARAGAGWLRQLDARSVHVEDGAAMHLGAGVDRVFVDRARARVRRAGLRLEARAAGRTGGIDVASRLRVGAAAAALVFVGF
jgi:hypothetical protein